MPLTKDKKVEIINEHKAGDKDTGSAEIQVALFTQRINDLTEHLKIHKKDHHTRRGLLNLINKRNKLLKYVYGKSHARYRTLVDKLGIRAKYDRRAH